MCTAALAIAGAGLAASIGGTLYSASQQSAYAESQNKAQQQKEELSAAAQEAERERQAQYDEQAQKNFQAQLENQSPQKFNEKAQEGELQSLDTTQKVATQSNLDQGLLPGQTGSSVSDVFTKDAARQTATQMADANKRISALARLSGYDRAAGYQSSASKQYEADAALLSAQAKRSLALGQQEGNVSAPWVGSADTSIGSGASSLGNAALSLAGNKGAWSDIKDIFSSGSSSGWTAAPGMTAAGYTLAPGVTETGSGFLSSIFG